METKARWPELLPYGVFWARSQFYESHILNLLSCHACHTRLLALCIIIEFCYGVHLECLKDFQVIAATAHFTVHSVYVIFISD